MSQPHTVPFEEAFVSVPVGKLKIKESEYDPTGSISVVDQGQNIVSGKTRRSELQRQDGPYIVFGDHTRIVKFVDFPFVVGADGVRLYKASEKYEPEFLYFFLKISNLPEDGYGRHSKYLKELCVPAIGKEKQRQIVARLKAQLAEVDKARQAASVQLREASLLRLSVQKNSFDSLLGHYDRNVCLKDVCSISAGGTPSRGNAAFFRGNIPWVKTLDLNFGMVTDTEESISPEAFRSIRGEMLPAGTVMVAMYGGAGTIGKSGILGIEACTNQAICALQPQADELDSDFLHEWLCYIRPEWMRLSGGNRKDPNINKSIVENMTLPLPKMDEQRRAITRLKSQLAEADTLRAALEVQQSELNAFPHRLLAQAFEM